MHSTTVTLSPVMTCDHCPQKATRQQKTQYEKATSKFR